MGVTCLAIKNCVRHEHVTYLVSSCFPTHGEHVEYLFWCHTSYRKFFRALWSSKSHQKSAFFKFLSLQISFLISIKSKKVACVHVFMHKNCLKHRMTTPFTSACTYGPKHVLNIIFECYQVTKKFWGEPKGTSNDLQNYNFFGYFKLILALEMILNTLSPKIIAWWRFCN